MFSHDGFFGNQVNSDRAAGTHPSHTPRNCFYRSIDLSGTLTSTPASIEAAGEDGQPRSGLALATTRRWTSR